MCADLLNLVIRNSSGASAPDPFVLFRTTVWVKEEKPKPDGGAANPDRGEDKVPFLDMRRVPERTVLVTQP
ncbi:hypothetical protein AAFF_G00346450 [Aldrovandia affinis]|uniref:Uncharacterized protein n=1 Tax=Aldrovandia affinis TaxID=143900 RepID=A0AAD7SKN6_9TELE|nr:hypothetical protein AAFF_G00346450 [Aldrovandia affinis]